MTPRVSPRLKQALARMLAGQGRSPLAWAWRGILAWPGVAGYRVALAWRDAAYRVGALPVHALDVPVVCIGNLSAGGTGKTPAVVMVARRLHADLYAARGQRVGILSRGYKPLPGVAHNDEAALLAQLVPEAVHVAQRDRVAAGRALHERLGHELGCVVLDDGFSHRRLARDVDVVLVDATRPLGLGELLPRGLLREPPAALARADAVLITRSDLVAPGVLDVRRRAVARWVREGTPIACAVHAPTGLFPVWPDEGDVGGEPLALAGERVMAVSGIGNPAAFRATLQRLGAEVVAEAVWPDHHPYTPEEIARMRRHAERERASMVVTTHKDAVRLALHPAPAAAGAIWRVLAVELTLEERGGDAWWQHLRTQVERARRRT